MADRKALRARTWRSFGVLAFGAVVLAGSWAWVWRQPLTDETPAPLRAVLEWNGHLWQSWFKPGRSGRRPPAPAGKNPRFNGSLGLESAIDLKQWSMEVKADGEGAPAPIQLTMTDLRLLPRTETTTLFKCIEGWSDEISYTGVRFSDFLKAFKLGTHSGDLYRYVGLETPDGEYYVSIDMDSMLHPQTVLAYEMNGQPLDLKNGAPLRLIIPVKYGIKSLKRIGRIFFSDQRPPDYWEEQGYDWFAGL